MSDKYDILTMPLPPSAADDDHQSTTPIYDALYATYRQSSRTLPGDRMDEDFTFEFGRHEPDEPSESGGGDNRGEPTESPASTGEITPKNRPVSPLPLPPAQRTTDEPGKPGENPANTRETTLKNRPVSSLPPLQRGNRKKRRGNRRKGR